MWSLENLLFFMGAVINGIIAFHHLGVDKRLKEKEIHVMDVNSDKVQAETIQDILLSAKEIIRGYKELAVDMENKNKIRDEKVEALQASLTEAKDTIVKLVRENEVLTRISVATCAGIEILVAQLTKEGIEPIWEVSPSIAELLKSGEKDED